MENTLTARQFFVSFAVAAVLTAAALGVSWVAGRVLPEMHSIPFFVAVLVASWYGGLRTGLLATVLATLVFDYFFIPPLYTLAVHVAELAPLAGFTITAIVLSKLARDRRRAEKELEQTNRELEQRVRKRTEELELLNERLRAEVAERSGTEAQLSQRTEELNRTNELLLAEVEERRSRERELKRSNEELDRFASVAGHDLQAPLRSITGFASIIMKRHCHDLPAESRECLEEILAGARRMNSLVQAVLSYSRTGGSEANRTLAPMRVSLDFALGNLKAAIEESGADIEVDPLPSVRIDHAIFAQVWQNLIANSIKYRCGAAPSIRVEAVDGNEEWAFAVKDNGIGIPLEHHERIFNLFSRLHTDAEYSGLGVGLAVCRKIIERHHGRIWVESQPGKGSTFHFTVPK